MLYRLWVVMSSASWGDLVGVSSAICGQYCLGGLFGRWSVGWRGVVSLSSGCRSVGRGDRHFFGPGVVVW